MSALMTANGRGVLTCNHTDKNVYDSDCATEFTAALDESVADAETRARDAGWATVEAFGSVAHMCPRHAR